MHLGERRSLGARQAISGKQAGGRSCRTVSVLVNGLNFILILFGEFSAGETANTHLHSVPISTEADSGSCGDLRISICADTPDSDARGLGPRCAKYGFNFCTALGTFSLAHIHVFISLLSLLCRHFPKIESQDQDHRTLFRCPPPHVAHGAQSSSGSTKGFSVRAS